MQFYEQVEISRFFNVSIIIPVQHNLAAFKKMIAYNQCWFQRNGIEVIVVLGNAGDRTAVINCLQPFYFISWKVIVSTEAGFGKQLPALVPMVAHRYIMLLDAGRVFFSDVIYQLRYILEHYNNSMAVARELCVAGNEAPVIELVHEFDKPVYGSIMVHRDYFIQHIGEIPGAWHGVVHHVIDRLELCGVKKMWVPQAVLWYEESSEEGVKKAPHNNNGHHNGMEIVYDWRTSPVSSKYLDNFLQQFLQYDVFETDFNQSYGILCLMQVRNERHHLPEVLTHVQQYCDGIILLDDESTDGSYEAAVAEKLLLKVQKKHKGFFDDLGNRNMLLQLGYLFKAGWFFIMDADERLDERYADIRAITQLNDIDVACFRLVNLWNNESYYRKNLPRAGDGLLLRYRMFRNKGFAQIVTDRELHFPAVPYTSGAKEAKILIKHYGLISEEIRQRKYHTYLQQDQDGGKQGHGYDYLLDTNCILGKIEDLHL